jgi:hypothetical protein
MPFAGYENFAACVAANGDKENPEAYCGALMRATEKLALRGARAKLTERHKFDPDQARADDGKWTDGGGGGGGATKEPTARDRQTVAPSDRASRALATHKPATAAKQRAGDRQQRLVARALRGKPTTDNDPVDIVAQDARGRTVGIEVKTFCDQANDKVTMHPDSLARKQSWARRARARLATVVVDARDQFGHGRLYSGTRYYVAHGVGSFRLGTMRGFSSLREATAFLTGRVA